MYCCKGHNYKQVLVIKEIIETFQEILKTFSNNLSISKYVLWITQVVLINKILSRVKM